MKLKRSIALVLSILTFFGVVNTNAQENLEVSLISRDAQLLVGLGLMHKNKDGDFMAQANFTRGEMAQLLADIVEYSETYDEEGENTVVEDKIEAWDFYEGTTGFATDKFTSIEESQRIGGWIVDDETTVQVKGEENIKVETVSRFKDVEKNNAIEKVAMYGIMNGYDNGYFYPNKNITGLEAIASVINLLGYRSYITKYFGGYPDGYINIANDLGLSVKNLYNPITRGEVAELIADILDCSLVEYSYSGGNIQIVPSKNNTVMSKFLGLSKLSGRMVQNQFSSLTGSSTIGENNIQIDRYLLSTSKRTNYAHDYLGYNVECYFFNDDTDLYGLIAYCRPVKNIKEEIISLKDIESFDGKTIKYYKNGRNKTVTVSDNPYYIYNGKAVTSYKDAYRESRQGTITLVSGSDNAAYDLVIIKSYESWYLEKAYSSDDKFRLVDKIDPSRNLEFEIDMIGKYVNIYNEDGSVAELSALQRMMLVDIMKNEERIDIIINSKVRYNFNAGISFLGNEAYISGNGEEYDLSNDLVNSAYFEGFSGTGIYDIFINSFGNVAYLEKYGKNGMQIGYVTKASYDRDEEKVYVKIVVDSKKAENFEVEEKITFSDNTGKYEQKRINSRDRFETDIKKIEGSVVHYNLNVDKKINTIEMALDAGIDTNSSSRLREIPSKGRTFNGQKLVDGMYYLTDATQILMLPADRSDISKYKFIDYATLPSTATKKIYASVKDPIEVEFCLAVGETNTIVKEETARRPYVILDVFESINDNDESIMRIKAWNGYLGEKTFTIEAESEMIQKGILPFTFSMTIDRGTVRDTDYYKLSKGDIIVVEHDLENIVETATILFDADGRYNNLQYQERLASAKETVDTEFSYGETGILAGSIGYWSNYISNTNPSLGSQGVQPVGSNTTKYWTTDPPSVMLAYVYDVTDDGYVTYTTKNLRELSGGLPDFADENCIFTVERRQINSDSWAYVDISGKNIEHGRLYDNKAIVNLDKIKSYKEYGSECSRILVSRKSFAVFSAIVINGNR